MEVSQWATEPRRKCGKWAHDRDKATACDEASPKAKSDMEKYPGFTLFALWSPTSAIPSYSYLEASWHEAWEMQFPVVQSRARDNEAAEEQ